MADTLIDQQRRILKLSQVLKNLNLPYASRRILTDEDPSLFKELYLNALEEINRLNKFLLLPESQIDKENIFKTIQLFLEQQEISGNVKEDLDENTRYIALDSAYSQLMTLRMCFWRDPSIMRSNEIFSIAETLHIEESEPVAIFESASKKITEMKPSLPLHSLEPLVAVQLAPAQHAKFDEINTQFKEEYARLKLRYAESFDRTFLGMMTGVSEKHERYLHVKQERARVKIEATFSLWDTYNARWDLVTDLSRCSLRRRNERARGKYNSADPTTVSNTNVAIVTDENSVKSHVESIQIEHVVTKAQMKYAQNQRLKQKKKDQKKRRKMKELGLVDTEEEKRAEHGEDDDNDEDQDGAGGDKEHNENDEDEHEQPKKKNRNKSQKEERRLKKKNKKTEPKATPVAINNNNTNEINTSTQPTAKADKKKQKFVVVVGEDGGVDVGEKH